MAEYTANAVQTVAIGQNVLFTETPICCNKGYVWHRDGAGIFTLRGITNQCKARYKVSFGGNIAVAEGGTLGPISLALTIGGEPVPATTMTVTPAAIGDFFNVFGAIYIDVPKGCCYTVAVENVSDTAIDVINSNLIVERMA